ncbi:rRNA-processing protein cgr1, partial [Claviceps citrina]
MSDDKVPTLVPTDGQEKTLRPLGMRKNGKQWHEPKKAFRPTKGLTSYERRTKERAAMAQMKAKEKELKEEKEQARK